MSYILNNLMDGERILHRGRMHGIVFVIPTIFLLLGATFMVLSLWADIFSRNFIFYPGLALTLVSALAWIITAFNYMTSEYAVTNKRIITKVGIISRQTMELLLRKVESVQVSQGILGRLFGYGTLIISGTGGAKNLCRNIAQPLKFRQKIHEQLERLHEPESTQHKR
ncbi:MAG: PH domain-containing protein [Lentisphaerae bacterium]|nr:MAG: PH domain-containing protein [Lentisphaerota bacterium]